MNKKQKGLIGLLLVGSLAIGTIFVSSVNQSRDYQSNRGGGHSAL